MAILQSRRRFSKPRTDAVGGMLGVGLLGGAANVIMQLARPGVGYGVHREPGRKRPDRSSSDQTGPHHLHLSRGRRPRHSRAAGGLPSRGQRRARPGVFDRREPGVLQRVRPGPSDVGGRLHVQGRRRRLQALRRRDRRRGFSAVVRRGHSARHDAAGASREVARRSGRVRSLLGGVGGEGAHRRRRARIPLAHRGRPGARGETARVGAAQARRLQPA